ncbi:Neurofibromin 1 [Balamuthia mandrillaris]
MSASEESDKVNELLIRVATALGINAPKEVDHYLRQWKRDIGLASRTITALKTLVGNEDRWKRVNLDEGVKALLEEEVEKTESEENSSGEDAWIDELFKDEDKWLQEPKTEWVEELEERLRGARSGAMAPHIVSLFEGSGRSSVLLRWAIETEAKGRDNRMCFREDNMPTSITTHYLQSKGMAYLDQVLQPVLKPFLEQRKPSTGNKHVVKLTVSLLEALCGSVDNWPTEIRTTTAYVYEKVKPLFKSDVQTYFLRVISNLFFLRFILPVIINPCTLPSCTSIAVSEQHSKILLQVSKLVQNVASEVANAPNKVAEEQDDPEEEWFKVAVERTAAFISRLQKKNGSESSNSGPQQSINMDAQRGALERLKLTVLEITKSLNGSDDSANLNTCRMISAPEKMAPLVRSTEQKVEAYFSKLSCNTNTGMIRVGEEKERYLALRAEALSVDFFKTVLQTLGERNQEEAMNFAGNLLYDLAHALGRADVRRFRKMSLYDAQEYYLAGPIHFSNCGWAFVDMGESEPPNAAQTKEEMAHFFTHPFSFEADVWVRAGKCGPRNPGCIMNSGYASGWCSEVVGVDLISVELMCKARGDDRCHFLLAHSSTIQRRVNDFISDGRQRYQWSEKQISSIKVPSFMESRLAIAEAGGVFNDSGGKNDANTSKEKDDKKKEATSQNNKSNRSNDEKTSDEDAKNKDEDGKKKQGGNWFMKGMKKILTNRSSEDLQSINNKKNKNKKDASSKNKKGEESGEDSVKNEKDLEDFLKGRFNGSFKRQPQYGQVTIANTDQRCVFIRAQALSCQFFDLIRELLEEEQVASAFASNFLFDLGKSVGRSDYTRLANELSPFFTKHRISSDAQVSAFKLHCAQMGFGKFTVPALSLPSFSSSSSSSSPSRSPSNINNSKAEQLSSFYAVVEVDNGFEASSWKAKWQDEEEDRKKQTTPTSGRNAAAKQHSSATNNKRQQQSSTSSSPVGKTKCFMTSGYVCGWLQGLRVKHLKQQKKNVENEGRDEEEAKKRRRMLQRARSEAKRNPLCAVEMSCVALGHKTCSFMVVEQDKLDAHVEEYVRNTTKQPTTSHQHQQRSAATSSSSALNRESLAMLDLLHTRCRRSNSTSSAPSATTATISKAASSSPSALRDSGSGDTNTTSSDDDEDDVYYTPRSSEAYWLDQLFAGGNFK